MNRILIRAAVLAHTAESGQLSFIVRHTMNKFSFVVALRLWFVAFSFVTVSNEAFGQDAFEAPIYLSVLPAPPTPNDNILLNFSIPNVGIAVGSTFAPDIEVSGNSILVTLNYQPPEIPPGGVGVPSAFFPDDTISLGMLAPGNYTVMAILPWIDDSVVASGSETFNVVPEPNAATICALAVFLFALPGNRLIRRCS